MDAVDLLEHDHRMVEQLFRDYGAAATDAQRRGVVEITIRELSKHAALEELAVYPFVRRAVPGADADVDQRLEHHMAIKQMLIALDRLDVGAPEEAALVADLEAEVRVHVAEDEDDLLPALRAAVDQDALDELGSALDDAKQIAPTRPHPMAPDSPPALALAAPFVAIYDRMRDRVAGRPRT